MAEQPKAESNEPKPNSNEEESKTSSNEDDLDELLDSALGDFDKFAQSPTSSDAPKTTEKPDEGKKPTSSDSTDASTDLMDEDAVKRLMSQFEETFQSFLSEGDESAAEFSRGFKKLAEETFKELKDASDDTSTSENDFSATIKETLEELARNGCSIPRDGNDLINMLGALAFDKLGSSHTQNDLRSFYYELLQATLSKDLLYPPLKELVNTYPGWLEKNKSSLSTEDYTRYSKQLEILSKVCSELEQTGEGDDEETKTKRFDIMWNLVQEMKEYGHPPKSLMNDALEMPDWF